MAQSKKFSRILIISVVLLAGSLAALGLFLYLKKKRETEEMSQEPNLNDLDDIDPNSTAGRYIENFQAIYKNMQDAGYSNPELLARLFTAQAAHESAIWASPLFVAANNMFGMNHPRTRPTTSIAPTSNGFATYDTPEDSIKDRILWDKYVQIQYPEDVTGFVKALKAKSYFEDTTLNYTNGVKKHLAVLNRLLNQG